MNASPVAADVTRAQFSEQVIRASHRLPVLVDFWAPWCGPCRVLAPVLGKLAEEYAGKFFLAKINTDAEQELGAEYAIRSIPAVKLIRHGQVVDGFVGVQPEPAIRALLDRYIPRAADAVIERAIALGQENKTEDAVALLRTAVAQDPTYDRSKVELARVLVTAAGTDDLNARVREATRLLDSLSIRSGANPEVEALRARIELLEASAGAAPIADLERAVAANSNNHAARLQLAARLALENEPEAALEHFLDLVRRSRAHGNDAGRKGLLAIFQLLGSRDPLVTKYRALLARTLN